MTRYAMAIDLNRCFGCQTCAVACKVANNMPKNISYNVVYTKNDRDMNTFGSAVSRGAISNDTATGVFPNCSLGYLPVACQHCSAPACLSVCPTGATQQRDDGIVWVDDELCIGCESCIEACPYDGVRTLIPGNAEYYLDVVVGEADAPAHRGGIVEKCTFCYNLIDRGEVPACMQLCPGRARYWGDIEDPDSSISQAMQGRNVEYLREGEGTEPSTIYLR